MGVGRGKGEMREMFGETSSVKMGAHKTFLKSLLDRGYKMESQEEDEDVGHEGEVISESLTTVLSPPTLDVPKLKFVAKETFGHYNFDTGGFVEYEDPKFDVKSYQKPAHMKFANDPWQMIDLDD